MTNLPGNPAGFTVLVNLGAGGGGWTDMTAFTTRANSLTITRAGISSPQTVTVRLWEQGGGLSIPDYAGVRIYDPYMDPGGLYVRYFNGFAQDIIPGIDGNANQVIDLRCVGVDWLWDNPPARPQATLTVGQSPIWLSNHPYTSGDMVVAFPDVGEAYQCTQDGTSGTTQPAGFEGSPGHVGITDGTCLWASAGPSAISDLDVWAQVLPIYYPNGEITYDTGGTGNMKKLIAAVPSFQVTPDMVASDVAKKLASFAGNRSYFATYSARAASTHYDAGAEIEQSPSVHGIIWRCTTAGTTAGGGAPAALTSTTTLGVTVTDGSVVWTSTRFTGRWEATITMTVGQRIEPNPVNGFWYQVIVPGTTGSSMGAAWTTTLGATFTNGTVGLQCMGLTDIQPVWQMWTPSDNFAHTASWTPDAAWFDANSDAQIIGPEYSDILPEDTEHLHYGTIVINRLGAPHKNRWYVSGKDDAFAVVDDTGDQTAIGMTIAGYYSDTSDTGPTTNNECHDLGLRLLAASHTQETVQIGSHQILDPVMIQKLSIGAITSTILGLGSQQYQAAQVSVTLGLGFPQWKVNFGAGFATGQTDPLEVVLGRQYAIDRTPPELVTFDTTIGHAHYFLLENTIDPTTQLARVGIQWLEQSVDTAYFDGYYTVSGSQRAHWMPRVNWPIENHTFTSVPTDADIVFNISATDHFGNVLRNADGTIHYAQTPTVHTPASPLPTSLANPSFEHLRDDGTAYNWTVTTVGAGTGAPDLTTAADGHVSFHFATPSPSDEVLLTSDKFTVRYLDGGDAGAQYYLDLKMKRGSHNINAIDLYIDWYDDTLTLVDTEVLVSGLSLLTTFSSYHYTAPWPGSSPDAVVAARLRFHCQPMSGAYDWWIDSLQFEQAVTPQRLYAIPSTVSDFSLHLPFDSGAPGTPIPLYALPAIYIPVNCTVKKAHLYTTHGDTISATVGVLANASQWPGGGDSITGATPPRITSGDHYDDTTLSGWSTTLTAGSWLIATLTAFSGTTTSGQLTLALDLQKS